MNLSLSLLPEAFNSIEKVGLMTKRLNPQLNSIRVLDGTISAFSRVLLILKCIVLTLHS